MDQINNYTAELLAEKWKATVQDEQKWKRSTQIYLFHKANRKKIYIYI